MITMSRCTRVLLALAAVNVAACSSTPPARVTSKAATHTSNNAAKPSLATNKPAPILPKAGSGRGGYYQDDGPGDSIPQDLENTVDPMPSLENYSRSGNKPYVVFGKTYTPITDSTTPLVQRGTGSWYGKKFHGQKTSSGELYDMYKMTAAHPTLPIPSYARVTNLENGKQIIVRINDRGPFHSGRIIDLSYTAALKLDYISKGSSQLEVERLLPADIERMAENRSNQTSQKAPAPENLAAQVDGKTEQKMEQKAEQNEPSLASSGIYLQFGAYAIRANAEAMLNHIKPQLDNSVPPIALVQQGSLYRLLSGPFTSREAAAAAVAEMRNLGVAMPVVLQR